MATLHQIGIRASSQSGMFIFKIFNFQIKKEFSFRKIKKKKKKKNPLDEDLRTNLFSQEEENDAKLRHDF